ncbi:hypothetical protein D3C80_1899740 [compost metagenome]
MPSLRMYLRVLCWVESRVAMTCSSPHSPVLRLKRAERTCTSAAPSRVPANQTAIRLPSGKAVTDAECTKSTSPDEAKRLV